MRQSSRTIIFVPGAYKVREIIGENFRVFKSMSFGMKLKFIRTQLEELYSKKEFSRGKVAKACSISYQGLKNIEEEVNKKSYIGTLKALCEAYSLPENFFDEEYIVSIQGFIIGKKEEKIKFFEDYYRQNLRRHELDPLYLGVSSDGGDHFEFDGEGYDIEQAADGSYRFNQFTINISMTLFQTSTNSELGKEEIVTSIVVAPEDVEHLKEVIRREAEYMHRKFLVFSQ